MIEWTVKPAAVALGFILYLRPRPEDLNSARSNSVAAGFS